MARLVAWLADIVVDSCSIDSNRSWLVGWLVGLLVGSLGLALGLLSW